MDLHADFQDGLIFISNLFFWHQGAYSCAPKRPMVCDKCYMRRISLIDGQLFTLFDELKVDIT